VNTAGFGDHVQIIAEFFNRVDEGIVHDMPLSFLHLIKVRFAADIICLI
jgi:hypothetical protein